MRVLWQRYSDSDGFNGVGQDISGRYDHDSCYSSLCRNGRFFTNKFQGTANRCSLLTTNQEFGDAQEHGMDDMGPEAFDWRDADIFDFRYIRLHSRTSISLTRRFRREYWDTRHFGEELTAPPAQAEFARVLWQGRGHPSLNGFVSQPDLLAAAIEMSFLLKALLRESLLS